MKIIFISTLFMSLSIVAGATNANGLSKRVVNLSAVSNQQVQEVKFRDKDGVCQYSGKAYIKKQSPSLMRIFFAKEKAMVISITSKECNSQVSSVELYAAPDQERFNKSISVFGLSSKIFIPQGSEFLLTKEKSELSWYEKM